VPKDYTGHAVNKNNFLAVLRGDASAVSGGSGKVINSGPNDTVFVAFFDHGAPGILGMPDLFIFPRSVSAKEINAALTDKAAKNGFSQLVFYIEACESGSIFEGFKLPANVAALTAANGEESSWGVYCPGMTPAPPKEFNTCLGDLFSVSWMEDTDSHVRTQETLEAQYERVKDRTSQNGTYTQGSHVLQFGQQSMDSEDVSVFLGSASNSTNPSDIPVKTEGVRQRDADLLHLFVRAEEAANTVEAEEARAELDKELAFRSTVDARMHRLAEMILGENGMEANSLVRPGQQVADDWDCYMGNFQAYEETCGALTQYGFKYGRLLANMCNAGHKPEAVRAAAKVICA